MKNNDKLGEILDKTEEYCEELKKIVFDFICHENVVENDFFYDIKIFFLKSFFSNVKITS